jgi:DNA invertase Pin-like site-specific DNA recombinase
MLLDQLKKRGVEVRSITEQGDMPETSETRLVRDILLRVAEYRRELIAAQTRAGHLKHMANGRSISRYAPYGKRFGPEAHIADRSGKFQVRKTLVDDDEEIQMAERIRMLHFEGSMGFSEIERQLNNEGLTCRNKPWHRAMIKKICKRAEA